MKNGCQQFFAALFLILMVSSVPIRSSDSEQYPAGIAGRVTTLDGAVVPGAEIEFSQGKKRLATKAKTDSKGEYWQELEPGIYDVSVELPSFKPTKRKKIKVDANGKSIVDFVLQPGKPIIIDADHP